MIQPWLVATGLVLDIVGVILLARDIYAALFSEKVAEAQLSMTQVRLANLVNTARVPVSPPEGDPMIMVDDPMPDYLRFTRRRNATIGMALVVGGFALQLIGSLPFVDF